MNEFKLLTSADQMNPEHYLAVRDDGLSFAACLDQALGCEELLIQFDRLYGATLVSRTAPIERMADEATGKQADDIRAFLRFVWNDVFLRTPRLPDGKRFSP